MIGTLASLISTARAALNGMEGRSRARGSSKRPHAPEVSAPETPTQAIESSKRRRVADACPLLELPEELLERALLYSTTPRDLCAIAQCSTRLRTISDNADAYWRGEFAERWGGLTELQGEAAKLAGSWKNLYASRAATDRTHAPWQKPSPFEVQVAVRRLVPKTEPEACVVFLIDGSGSVTEDDFSCMTSFVTQAIEHLNTQETATQVAVVQFSNDCRLELAPSPIVLDQITNVLEGMYRMNGGTNISLAVQRAGQLLKPMAPQMRRVLVLLTDGRIDSHQAREAHDMAQRLADEQGHVCLYAFGVGRGVDRAELLRIISARDASSADSRYLGLCTLDESPW
ncbi:hypothetical protein ACKKBG_A10990 [Auxenochlorella protothecoides x Auxenochlorella symbiontica]